MYQHLSVQSLIERGLPPQMEVYNLAFRDGIAGTDGFSDQKTSNNGDMEMVYPQLQILFFIFGKVIPKLTSFLQGVLLLEHIFTKRKLNVVGMKLVKLHTLQGD